MRTTTAKILSALGSAALTAATVGLTDPAFANVPAAPETHVAYSRSELGTAEGRAAIRQRIEDASRAVCINNELDHVGTADCRRQAAANANRALFAQIVPNR